MPIQEAADVLKSGVVDILPAVHALTGCGTTSTVGSKCAALQAAEKYGYDLPTPIWKNRTGWCHDSECREVSFEVYFTELCIWKL